MTPDSYELRGKYRLREKDLLEAQTRHAGVTLRITQVTGVFMIVMGIAGFAIDARHNFGGLVMVPIGGFLAFRLRLTARQSYKRDFKGRSDTEVVISESGIEFLAPQGTSDLNWMAFVRYRETKNLFLLYTQSDIFNVVPKGAFEAGQLALVRDILQRKLSAKSAAANRKLSPQLIVFLLIIIVMVLILAGVVFIQMR